MPLTGKPHYYEDDMYVVSEDAIFDEIVFEDIEDYSFLDSDGVEDLYYAVS